MSNKTALFESHQKLDATMVDFAGYLMPMRYRKTSIIDEHLAVRNEVGMFDTSHMGRIWVKGLDALDFLNLLVPRELKKITDNRAGYSFMLNESGGFRDDVIITRFHENEFMVVCNAGNFVKIWNWMNDLAMMWEKAGKEVELENRTNSSSMIAVQGPKALSLLEKLSNDELPEARFRIKWINIENEKILFSTTGYTGASGGELILFSSEENIIEKTEKIWNLLMDNGVMPCALGSRDTLRMEAGYRLYGNDLSEEINLLESGLDFVPFAQLDKETGFIGQKAVLKKKGSVERIFVGFKLLERGIPRHGNKIIFEGKEIGEVLSGTQSPLSKVPFGMALVSPEFKTLGSKFSVDIRGKIKEAEVINFPFYDESIYGIKVRR